LADETSSPHVFAELTALAERATSVEEIVAGMVSVARDTRNPPEQRALIWSELARGTRGSANQTRADKELRKAMNSLRADVSLKASRALLQRVLDSIAPGKFCEDCDHELLS